MSISDCHDVLNQMSDLLVSGSRIEVHFVVDDLSLAIEAKASRVITDAHLKGLRQLAIDQSVKRRAIVCLEPKRRVTVDGITVVPAGELADFVYELTIET
jgi:uncharacterized protein